MLNQRPEPIDYLVIGHVTNDVLPGGELVLGGTAAFAALTVQAMGLRPGIVTMIGEGTAIEPLQSIPIAGTLCSQSTTFENVHIPGGRKQIILHRAPTLHTYLVPDVWRKTPIVHFGPLANEIDLNLLRIFPDAMICMTLQGWLRSWDRQGNVFFDEWPEYSFVLPKSNAAVLSSEDVNGDEAIISEFAAASEVLVVTEGEKGGRIYIRDEEIRFEAPETTLVDPVGAGDIFAAVFFRQLYRSGDPLQSAQFAAQLAAHSVSRSGLSGVPTPEEFQNAVPLVY